MIFRRHLLLGAVCLILAVGQNCWATTVMVTVRADFSNATISPSSLQRAKQMVADIESSLLDEFFQQGHISFNLPLAIRTLQSPEKPPTVDELLWESARGGAEILVYCTVQLQELKPNEPVQVQSCLVMAYGVHTTEGFPLNWKLPITAQTRDTDLQTGISQTAQLISAHLANFISNAF